MRLIAGMPMYYGAKPVITDNVVFKRVTLPLNAKRDISPG